MAEPRSERLFTFRSGGWVIALALVVTAVGTVWNLAPLWRPGRERPRGDGRQAASYGFELTTTLVPRERIVSSGMVADGLKALVAPRTIPVSEIPRLAPASGGRLLVSSDKVVGVLVGGEPRAYPLRMLAWHEIVDDTVGGLPIAVTYNPISEGIAVFDRRVGDETLIFGVSGLLYQSNLLLYDRRPGHRGESLWSQLQARAIAGPLAASEARLTLVPFALCRWADWIRAHPDSRVLAPLPGERELYESDAYASYVQGDELRFPVDPLPPEGSLPRKTRIFASAGTGARTLTPLRFDDAGERLDPIGPTGTTPALGMVSFWFAWYATHADDPGTIAGAAR